MKEIATLKGLMVRQLQSILEAEQIWAGALMETATVISDSELKKMLQDSSKVASGHAEVLRHLLSEMDATSLERRNAVAEDLAREMKDVQQMAADREVQDAGLLVVRQCMNHYLIAKYGTVASYARLLNWKEMGHTLHQMLEVEKREDESLTKLAEKRVNERAKNAIIL